MARIRNGILGGFSGKVGEVIGQTYQGISTMRAMPKYVFNPNTQAQVNHRKRVAFVGDFLTPLKNVLNLSTYGGNKVFNGYNKAFRSNFPNFVIQNDAVVISDLDKLDLGTYYGEPFWGMQIDFTPESDSSFVTVSMKWQTTLFSHFCYDTDRPILFLLQEMYRGVYKIVYCDLLECQRSWGSYLFTINMPEKYDPRTNFHFALGYTIYDLPAIQDTSNRANLREIDWEQYYWRLMERYYSSHLREAREKFEQIPHWKPVPSEVIRIPSS